MSVEKTKHPGRNIGRFLVMLGFFALVLLRFSTAFAATVSEGYLTSSSISPGSVVSIKQNNPKEVELSNKKNATRLLGVVTTAKNSAVNYAKDNSSIDVATSGDVDVFVTDANGSIKKGDNIVVSWIEGIGMKATAGSNERLIGVSLADFDSTKARSYKTQGSGSEKTININSLALHLYQDATYTNDITVQKGSLVGTLTTIAGHDISYVRGVICLIVFILCLVVSALYVGTSLYGSFISLGRNPLAGSTIFKSLSRVTLIGVAILLIGSTFSYVVLVV
jgi:hypothetical protein